MDRRDFIGVMSAASLGMAGCLDLSNEPSVSDQPLSEYNCHPDGINSSNVVCTELQEETDGPLTLTSSVDETTDIAEVDLTLRNISSEEVRFNPGNWEAWVEQDGEWDRIEQTAFGHGFERLDPDQTYWTDVVTVVNSIRTYEYNFLPGTYFLVKQIEGRNPATLVRLTSE